MQGRVAFPAALRAQRQRANPALQPRQADPCRVVRLCPRAFLTLDSGSTPTEGETAENMEESRRHSVDLVCIQYEDLMSGQDLSRSIGQAYGPDGLGVLVVAGVPRYVEARGRLLPLAAAFARLPADVKALYEDAASHYSFGEVLMLRAAERRRVANRMSLLSRMCSLLAAEAPLEMLAEKLDGWSHGRESMASGQPDTHKGSFYANPLWDTPEEAAAATGRAATNSTASTAGRPSAGKAAAAAVAAQRHISYLRPNIWPRQHLPELELAFKDLGGIICCTGKLLMEHCDRYVASRLDVQPGQLVHVLQRSRNPKARLLHYFASAAAPEPGRSSSQEQQQQQPADEQPGALAPAAGLEVDHEQAWCGWHHDHGSLTGLTSAMYIDAAGRQVPNPDALSGLYVRNRHGQVVKANIPPDCVAFQVGESLQVHSGGLLRGTPHYVRAAYGPAAAGISRNTFAVFMQPDVEEPMVVPQGGATAAQVAIGQWRPGQSFGEFAEETFKKYYANG